MYCDIFKCSYLFLRPGTYKPSDKKREMKFYHSFNGKKIIVPAVDVSMLFFNILVTSFYKL